MEIRSRLGDAAKRSLSFWKSMFQLVDAVALVTFLLYTASVYKFLGLEAAAVLAVFYWIRAAGHFWGLRQCGVLSAKVRFLPFLGGYIQTLAGFYHRGQEGFSALGASIWVLASALTAFMGYILFGNLTCLFFASIAFSINLFSLFPIGVDLDGTAVLKSISFSLSRLAGLIFMFLNIFAIPAIFYWILSQAGPVDILWLSPSIIAGVQRFSEEYNLPTEMERMNYKQMRNLAGLYFYLFVSFLVLPTVLGISAFGNAVSARVVDTAFIGIAGLMILSVVESNIIFFVGLKRRLFGNI